MRSRKQLLPAAHRSSACVLSQRGRDRSESCERPRFSLTERELGEYSLAHAILIASKNQEGTEENCLELEISQELERQVSGEKHGGVYIPGICPLASSLARARAES